MIFLVDVLIGMVKVGDMEIFGNFYKYVDVGGFIKKCVLLDVIVGSC